MSKLNWDRVQKEALEKRNGVEWTTTDVEHSLSNSTDRLVEVHSEWAREQRLRTLREPTKTADAGGRNPNDRPIAQSRRGSSQQRQYPPDKDLAAANPTGASKRSFESVSTAKVRATTEVVNHGLGRVVVPTGPRPSIYAPDAATDRELEGLLVAGNKTNAIALLRQKRPLMTSLEATAYIEALEKYELISGPIPPHPAGTVGSQATTTQSPTPNVRSVLRTNATRINTHAGPIPSTRPRIARTITLTDRPPVRIYDDEWPIIAQASCPDTRAMQVESRPNGFWSDWLKVRRHIDSGRAIVYGGGDHTTAVPGKTNISYRCGEVLDAGANIAKTIRRVCTSLAQRGALESATQKIGDSCIADLPVEDL
jgi:hypothetical protein